MRSRRNAPVRLVGVLSTMAHKHAGAAALARVVLPVLLLLCAGACATRYGTREETGRLGCLDPIEAYRDWDHAHADWDQNIKIPNFWCPGEP